MITAKMTTLARPYALAAFEYAVEKNALAAWDTFLGNAALVVQNNLVTPLFSSPDITPRQLNELFFDVLASVLDIEKKNFIQLLSQNKRLPLLPDIAELFKNYRAEQDQSVTVQVVSAAMLEAAYQQKLIVALTTRLKRKVLLECEVDPSLLGGALIRTGDTVIDGSVRGKLNRLVEYIS